MGGLRKTVPQRGHGESSFFIFSFQSKSYMSRPSFVATVAFFRGGLRRGRARIASLVVGRPWKDQGRRACRASPGRIEVAWCDVHGDQGASVRTRKDQERVRWRLEG